MQEKLLVEVWNTLLSNAMISVNNVTKKVCQDCVSSFQPHQRAFMP